VNTYIIMTSSINATMIVCEEYTNQKQRVKFEIYVQTGTVLKFH